MTDMKHTPGPFHVGANQPTRVFAVNGQIIADCDKDHIGIPIFEANARLFAAAPETASERDRLKAINAELLVAVNTAEDLLAFHEGSAERENEKGEPVVWVNNDDLERVLAVLRAAIAKGKTS